MKRKSIRIPKWKTYKWEHGTFAFSISHTEDTVILTLLGGNSEVWSQSDAMQEQIEELEKKVGECEQKMVEQ
jgi:hypothetical protein